MNAELRSLRTEAETALAESFAAVRDSLPGSATVKAAREHAFAAFEGKGLPHRRTEPWRYTDLRALLRTVPPLAAGAAAATALPADPLPGLDRARLVIVDGVWQPQLSDLAGLDGVAVTATERLLAEGDERLGGQAGRLDDAMVALNTALMAGGVAIDVPAGSRSPMSRPARSRPMSATTSRSAPAVRCESWRPSSASMPPIRRMF